MVAGFHWIGTQAGQYAGWERVGEYDMNKVSREETELPFIWRGCSCGTMCEGLNVYQVLKGHREWILYLSILGIQAAFTALSFELDLEEWAGSGKQLCRQRKVSVQRNGALWGMARILVCWDKGRLSKWSWKGLDNREHFMLSNSKQICFATGPTEIVSIDNWHD